MPIPRRRPLPGRFFSLRRTHEVTWKAAPRLPRPPSRQGRAAVRHYPSGHRSAGGARDSAGTCSAPGGSRRACSRSKQRLSFGTPVRMPGGTGSAAAFQPNTIGDGLLHLRRDVVCLVRISPPEERAMQRRSLCEIRVGFGGLAGHGVGHTAARCRLRRRAATSRRQRIRQRRPSSTRRRGGRCAA